MFQHAPTRHTKPTTNREQSSSLELPRCGGGKAYEVGLTFNLNPKQNGTEFQLEQVAQSVNRSTHRRGGLARHRELHVVTCRYGKLRNHSKGGARLTLGVGVARTYVSDTLLGEILML